MSRKCNFCGKTTEYSVSGGFCSYSCKRLYRSQIVRDWVRMQREFIKKYRR